MENKKTNGRRLNAPTIETLLKDLRFAVRMFRKNPGFTAIAVLTLTLGIGANAAIFSIVNTIALRPLPINHPEQIRAVSLVNLKNRDALTAFSYLKYKDYRDRNDVLSGPYAYRFAPISLSRGGANERIWSYLVSGNYFDVLGLNPARGRFFTQAEDLIPDANPVAVVSYACWQTRFGGDPNLIGKTVLFNSHPFSIIGVAPKGFTGTEMIFTAEVWVPFMMAGQIEPGSGYLNSRGNGGIFVGGRLKPGVTEQQAQSSLNVLAAQLGKDYPDTDQGTGIGLSPPGLLLPQLRNPVLAFAAVLMATVCLVLLIACINLASLLLARATGRRREIAIRLAIGAGRTRIIRQLLTESVLLAVLGGAGGILLAVGITKLVTASRLPIEFPLTINLEVDWRVALFTLLISVVTGVVFGLAPALQSTKTDLVTALKDDSVASGYKRSIMRNILVVAQIGLSLVLLIAAGLVVRSLQHAQIVGPGFETERALTMSVDLGLQGYNEQKGRQFYRQLVDRVQTLPGVRSASVASYLPLGLDISSNSIFIEGRPVTRGTDTPEAYHCNVEPKYFETMGIPLVAGRDFGSRDKEDSTQVAIINETFAHHFWPSENAVGKRFRLGSSTSNLVEVVGIAKDGKYFSLGETPHAFAYSPLQQNYTSHGALVIRTANDPQAMIATIRHEVQQLDSNLPIYDIKTLSEHMGVSLFPLRIGAWVVGSFGLLALVLAAIGIYGTMAYSVSQRVREVGIRMALGAGRGAVLRLVIKQGLLLAAIGLAAGLVLSFFASQLLTSVLYGISPTDIIAFAGVTGLLAIVVFLACLIPATRATRVDPMIALRHE